MQNLIYFLLFTLIVQKINCLFCPTDQCFSKAQSKCLDIIQNNYTGISKQGYCVSDGEQSQIDKCLVMQNQICVNQLNTMCIMLANSPSSDFIGIFQDESSNLTCIEQSDVQNKAFNAQDIKLLNSAYCYQNDRLIYPYQHPLDSINCQCQPKQCFDGSNCLPMDENINVGINNQGRCVGINKIDDLKDCYQPLFCLQKTSQSQSQCIPFLSQTQVIGVFQEKNVYLCVLINDISQPLPKNSVLIYLQINYCINQLNQIVDMKVSSKQIVGVTKNKSCVTINTQIDQSDQIDSCIYGYCISQQNCVQMNGRSIISKLQNNQCGGDSQTNFKECYASFQTSPLTCIQNNTCEVIKNSKNIVGVKSGLQCIYQDDLLQDKNQIQFCSKFHCIQNITTTSQVQQQQEKQTVTVNITLTSFKCQQQDYWLGSDSQGYCINSTQMICIKDNQCLYIDPMTQQQQCQLLSGQQNSPYFAKEDQTTKCLPFKSIKDSGQNIDKCPDGYCIYEPSYQQKYCVTIGDYVNGQLFIGREIDTQYCLIPLQLSFGIETCNSDQYCILKLDQSYVCHPLMEISPFQSRTDVRAKHSNGSCLDLNETNSISCLLGDYCLLSGVCFKLSYQNINTIGRSSDNSCLPANTQLSTNCAMGYCLLKLECIPLSPQYPGRENLTENCLQEYETKSFGAQQCCSQYCLQLGQTQMLNQCVSLDYQNPNQIGIYKDSGTCVSQSDQYIPHQNQLIQTCFQGVYCINTNQNGEYCQKVEGNIKCSDSQGKCVSQNSSSQCYRCPFSQCLQNGVCIPLNNQFCQDVLGKCLRIQQSGCTVCPLGFCLQQQNGTCLSQYLVNTSDYAHTECLLQYRQDAKCYKQDINQINKFQTNICKDQFNICQIITSNDQAEICLICPQFFANPGNRQCYKKIKNVQNGYFNFELQYIQEDCFPNSICSQGSIKCPEGCRSCQDENTCTLCIENYFLFFDSQRQKQMCVKCDNSEYEYQVDSKSQLFNYVTKLNIQCAECNLQSNQWANSQYLQKICTQFVVSIAGVKKLSDKFSTSFYYQVQKANPQGSMFKITRIKQPDQCEPQCLSCDIDLKGNARCIKCQQLYYVNSLYQCSQCPLGCLECGMSMIEDNRILNFEDLTYEQYKNNRFNFQISILTCRYCKDGYMVSENLSSCEQCGYACLKCTYQQGQNYVNSKIFGLAVYPTNKLNKYCLQCNQGYTLDIYNRFDCNKLYTPYCSDTDLLVYNTKHSKTYFQYRADKKQDVVVTSCNICYPGSCLYDYYCLINYQNPEDVYTNSYLCQGYFFKCTFSDSYGNCFNWKQYGIYLTIDKSFQEQPLIINSTPPNYSDLKRKCSNLIPNCINCLEFTNYKEGILYQCTKCKYGYIPSISQCIPCPDGCQSCFEAGYLQNDRVNFTNIFVNERNILSKLTFQQRIQYQETYKIDMLCSSCLDGRQLNSNQTSCDLPKCGSFCSKCIFYLDEPLCVQCNKNLLFSYIMPIQMYISNMYFNSDYLKEFNQMITYDSSQQNCKLCPMLCETCEDRVNQFAEGSLYFYQTKCYTCKQKIVSEYLELQRYQIRYGRQRKKCQLCLINDKGCYFKKVSKIYVYCGNQSQLLGKGTIDDPYNISKLQGQNLNEIILNELDFMRALVSYNELQLREIEIIIEYVDQNYICYENIQLAIQTNLKAQIYSLEYLSLTIRANQTQNNQNFVINQIKSAIITGFNKIVIENIDFIQKQKEDSFGFVIQNNFIDSLTVTNSSFSQISNISNLFTLRILQFNGTMIINNLRFNNITISSSKLINIQFLLPSSSLKYGIQNLVIFNCSLQSSYLLQLYQSANLMINNIQILNSNLTQSSTVIKAFLDYQNSLQISTMFINQFTCNSSNILNSSILINTQNFQQTYLSDLLIFNNNIIAQSQNSNAMLFNIDFLNVTNFNFKGNNLIDAIIFSLSQTSNIQSQNNQYNFTTIKFQENKIITQNSVIFKLEFISNAQVFLNNFLFQNNIFDQFDKKILKSWKYFYFQQINNLLMQKIIIQDETIIQFMQVKDIQSINADQFIVGRTEKIVYSTSILDFKSINTTCIFTNSQFIQLISYQNLIQINQIKNQQEANNKLTYQIKFINVTLQGLQLYSYYDKTFQYQIQSFIRIDSKVDGSIIFQNLTALNVSKFNNQNNDDTYDPNMTTSSLWISNQVGYLEINDSIFTSQKYNQQHYMLQIASTYVNITNTIFDQLSNNQIQQSSVKGGLTQVNCQALNLLNCTFKGGIAFQGGAIYWSAIDQAKILIDKSLFINNKSQDRFYAEESYGGAIFIDITLLKQTLQIFILNSDFQNNLSLSRGGSIYISKSKSKYFLVVRNSNFTDNISVQGSAIYSLQSNYQSQILFQIIQFKLSNNMINLSKNMLSYAQKSLRQNELPSHFRIQNHYSLDFVQCSFTSSLQYLETNNYENNFLLLTYQSLFNIQAINKLYFLKNQHKNMVTFNNLIKINCLNVQFQYEEYSQNTAMAQLNLIQSNQQNSLVYIKSNQTTINQIVFENNSCSACQQGSIYINSIYLLIINSLFQKNVALNGGSLYLTIPSQIKSSRLLIQNQFQYNQIQTTEMIQILQNCSFIQNIATINGGAIFIENSNLYISESFFAQNKAYSYGGAIASNSNNKNVVDNVNIINSKFILNEAKIGSAFFQLQNLPIKSIYQNVLANNKAQLYGNSLVSQPVGYQGVQEGKQKNKRIILTNFTSGIISIKLINTESEVVSELQDYIILSFETDQQDITIIPNQIRQKSGIFHLKDIMSVNGRLGSNITVNVTSNLNYIPIYDELGNLINTQQSEPFYLIIQFINLCPKGTSLIQDSQKKDFCFNCPTGTFNLNDGSKCFKCPFVCKKDQMFLPIGYWRSSLIDYTYQSCLIPFNCFGDVDRIVPQQLQSSSNRYWNVGILCLDCDIEGQFWSESFYQITPFRCLKCGVQFNIMSIIIALANVSFYYFMIREIQNILAFLKLKQVFLLLGQRIFYKPQIFYMLNNFIEYIQIISLISPLMNDLPLQLYQIILEFTNFPLNMLKILDCELYKLFNMQYFPYWYFRIVIALIFQFLICLIVTILLYIEKCNKTTIQTFNLFIWIHSIPYIFKLCIGMSSFISLEGQNYIKDYPSLLWSNNQIGLITCLVLIMGQIFFITAINFYLSSYWNNQLYNIFTFLNQSNKYIWWESFSIGYRMLLNLIESLFFQVNSIKSSILCCLSLSYCISIFYYWPYQSKQRNQVKIIIHFGFSVCFGIMNYIDSNVAKDSSIILIYLIQVFIIPYFISHYLKNKIIDFITKKSKRLQLQRQSSQKHWKKLKFVLQNKSWPQINLFKKHEKQEINKIQKSYKIINQIKLNTFQQQTQKDQI